MDQDLISYLISITQNTGVFKDHEIKVLDEVLSAAVNGPESGYILLTEESSGEITGFTVFGRTSCTDMTWDMFWLVVANEKQGKGIAKKLLERAEKYVLSVDRFPVFRVETSSRNDYARARAFYDKSGFLRSGTIPDFYAKDDDLIIYYKKPGIGATAEE